MKPRLIAMVGLPRSGKSTIARELSLKFGAPIVCRDAVRLAMHGMRFQTDAEPMIHAVTHYMLRALFITGHEIVICDETNYSIQAREKLRSKMWDTEFYVVDTPVSICKERARLTNQVDLIPVIDAMAKRYQPLGRGEQHYKEV